MIFDQQLKFTFRKSSATLKKSTPPFYSLPPKNSKGASPPFLPILKIFQPHIPAERGENTAIMLTNMGYMQAWFLKDIIENN